MIIRLDEQVAINVLRYVSITGFFHYLIFASVARPGSLLTLSTSWNPVINGVPLLALTVRSLHHSCYSSRNRRRNLRKGPGLWKNRLHASDYPVFPGLPSNP